MAATPVYAYWAIECGPIGGLWHSHALVGNVAHLKEWCGKKLAPNEWGRSCCLLHSWRAGYSRVVRYDPALGLDYYVAKYVAKGLGDWGLYGFPVQYQEVMS